jgi:hypothetical protein
MTLDLRKDLNDLLAKYGYTDTEFVVKYLIECMRVADEQIFERGGKGGTIEIMINISDDQLQ